MDLESVLGRFNQQSSQRIRSVSDFYYFTDLLVPIQEYNIDFLKIS